MITDENHPRMRRAQRELADTLMALLQYESVGRRAMQKAADYVEHHRAKWRKDGVDFPAMAVMPILFGDNWALELVRKDLSTADMRTMLLNLTVKYPGITAQNIAFALQKTFPHMRGIDVGNLHVQPYDLRT